MTAVSGATEAAAAPKAPQASEEETTAGTVLDNMARRPRAAPAEETLPTSQGVQETVQEVSDDRSLVTAVAAAVVVAGSGEVAAEQEPGAVAAEADRATSPSEEAPSRASVQHRHARAIPTGQWGPPPAALQEALGVPGAW
jgi:hypothetical protein